MNIRTAKPSDAEQLLSIYAPYVLKTAISFEYEVPSLQEFHSRIEHTLQHYPYLVATNETDGRILGYAYAGPLGIRAAYQHSVETSIYVDTSSHRQGVGRQLYLALEAELKTQGILNAYACIAWTDTPNQYLTHQSPEFHARMGYKKVAHLHKCGYKFNQWIDIIWMEKMLGEHQNT